MRTAVQPGSGSWAPGVDRTVDKIAGYVAFRKAPPGHSKAKENGNDNGNGNGNGSDNDGPELQLWTVSDGNGLQVLRFTDDFIALHKDLLEEVFERARLGGCSLLRLRLIKPRLLGLSQHIDKTSPCV